MDRFENVTVIKKANLYFDGNVASHTVLFADGTRKTLGVVQPGQYEFETADSERMEILSGCMKVMLPGYEDWDTHLEGYGFEVPANTKFIIYATEVTEYCCSYIKE